MKKIILSAAVFFAIILSAKAQDAVDQSRLAQVLQSYYAVKDALVKGDVGAASAGATVFIKNLNGISYKLISEGNVNVLLHDAGTIADAKNLNAQRNAFANFSTNMTTVAKALKLSDKPVYIQYCPMKKASWLSSEQAIKNPYYGSAMLSCGEVTDTIQ
ncbi:MAG: DUF3347 domain-containing protein [Flavisolibacter sp.]